MGGSGSGGLFCVIRVRDAMQITLAELIATDPDGRGYAAMSDNDITVDLYDPRHTLPMSVPVRRVKAALLRRGEWQPIFDAAEDGAHPAHRYAWIVTQMAVDLDGEVNFFNEQDARVISVLMQAELVAPDCLSSLQRICSRAASLLELHGLTGVTAAAVAAARGV